MDSRASDPQDPENIFRSVPIPLTSDQKYCSECGKIILRRAELCPGCGCRVMPPTPSPVAGNQTPWQLPTSPQLQSQFVSQMAILLIVNCLWAGLGNLAVGDKRGWSFGFVTWLAIGLSFLIPALPLLAWFAFASYLGYQFLQEREAMLRTNA